MKILLAALILVATAVCAEAKVVRPAPDVALAPGSRPASIRGFKKQPVVVVFARSPRDKWFREQAATLEKEYRRFASRNVIFVASFGAEAGAVKSSIPFLVAAGNAAPAFGLKDRGVAVIAADGNMDLVTEKKTDGRRVREVLDNTFEVQRAMRR